MVLGVLADKDAAGIVAALAPVARIRGDGAGSPRALPAAALAAVVEAVTGVRTAVQLREHRRGASPRGRLRIGRDVVVTGSLTTAGQARTDTSREDDERRGVPAPLAAGASARIPMCVRAAAASFLKGSTWATYSRPILSNPAVMLAKNLCLLFFVVFDSR